jgi:M-phase inducer tyrosine phosphatase
MFGGKPFGPNSFNFRDMSMKKTSASGDYFALPSIPGSSPTASLAADMSSNLHVDQRLSALALGPLGTFC